VIRGYVSREVQRTGETPEPEAAFKFATEKIKRMHSDKFKPAPRATSAVGSTTTTPARTNAAKPKKTWADLSEDQQKVGNNFVRQKAFTKDEYIAALVEIGEV